jgi:diguanylate cyclase (GGDEF)-like protein
VLFLDLDEFKPINDAYGHFVGDQVLQIVAQRIRTCIRGADVAARLGGDEFVVALPLAGNSEQTLTRIMRALGIAIEQPMKIGDRVLRVTVSIGMAIADSAGKSAQDLIGVADRDMYEHKRAALASRHASPPSPPRRRHDEDRND